MKPWPLRRKLALWSASVTAFALITFGIVAAVNLQWEKSEARDSARKGGGETPDDSLGELLEAYGFALPVVVIVVAAGSWWIGRRALRPIVAITDAAAAITAARLDSRLAEPAARDEVGQHVLVLNAMFDRLQRSFELATRFTADASHELRTPLSIVRGEIEEELRRGDFTPDQQRFLAGILEQVGRLQQIASNLLLLSRFDNGHVPLPMLPVDFTQLVREAAEDAELLAASAGIKVSSEVESGIRVGGDALLLKRVLLNLVDNAVRYNRPEGRVALRLRRESGSTIFTLANTGPGIRAESQAELFKRFYRAEGDRNRETGGSGLGLSLCREIVVAHGGAIALEESAADRTTFGLRLPLLEG